MRGEFYKMDFEAWDEGTVDLPLELEAAYLRLCHQMYRTGGAIPNSLKLLQGLFRCGHTRLQHSSNIWSWRAKSRSARTAG